MSIHIVAHSVKDYRDSKKGGCTPLYGLYGDVALDRQGMVFVLSVQNRVYNFVRVCSDKQGIACMIDDDFICLVKFVFTP